MSKTKGFDNKRPEKPCQEGENTGGFSFSYNIFIQFIDTRDNID